MPLWNYISFAGTCSENLIQWSSYLFIMKAGKFGQHTAESANVLITEVAMVNVKELPQVQ